MIPEHQLWPGTLKPCLHSWCFKDYTNTMDHSSIIEYKMYEFQYEISSLEIPTGKWISRLWSLCSEEAAQISNWWKRIAYLVSFNYRAMLLQCWKPLAEQLYNKQTHTQLQDMRPNQRKTNSSLVLAKRLTNQNYNRRTRPLSVNKP